MDELKQRFPFYSRLLKLYPRAYQQTYGEQMLQTLADMLDDPERSKVGVWIKVIADFPFSLVKQQVVYAGEVMAHDTPPYVKASSALGAVLLLPFIAALIANGLDRAINNRTLYHSWLWHMPLLAIWVLWLPVAATIITFASLLALLIQRSKTEHISWRQQLFDLGHTWSLLVIAVIGLAIVTMVFGHDSVHCVIGNPVREAQAWHQTWRCIQQR